MRRSPLLARIISIVFAVIAAPAAIGLLSAGGRAWYFAFTAYAGVDSGLLVGPLISQAVGIVLLLAVVATGFWTSAGLLTVGVLALVNLVLAVFPALLMPLYRGPLPMEWMDGIAYGIPLALFTALGAMGLVLLLARRRPARPNLALTLVGIVASPLLLAAGGCVLGLGIARSLLVALQQLRLTVSPDGVALLLLGVILIAAGVLTTRWSPFALLLPAVALLVLTPLTLSAGGPVASALFDVSTELARGVAPLLVMGSGVASAVAYLLFTGVLLWVRSRAAAPAAGNGYPPLPPEGVYPPAPGYPPADGYPPAAGS
jgi:hypothetical protein